MGAFTGTLDFAANDNNVSLGSMSITGAGARTLNMGDGTWTITGTGTVWDMSTTTNLTFAANASTLVFTATNTATRLFVTSATARAFNNITINGNSSGGDFFFNTSAITIANLTVNGPNYVRLSAGVTYTLTAFSINGVSGSEIAVESSSLTNTAAISTASGSPTITWGAFRRIACSGGATFVASNSFDLGGNTGITINAPGAVGAPGLHAIDQGIAA